MIKIIEQSRPYFSRSAMLRGLSERLAGRKTPAASFAFSVRFEGGRAGAAEVNLRAYDALYFSNPYSPEAAEHLDLILQARRGNNRAQAALRKMDQEALDRLGQAKPERSRPNRFDEFLLSSGAPHESSRQEAGNKGYNLLALSAQGFPVPSFCIIKAGYRKAFIGINWSKRNAVRQSALTKLEALTGKKYDNDARPLLFAIRSCLPESLPGILPTYLAVGATQRSLPGLVRLYGERTAYELRANHLMSLLLAAEPIRYQPLLDGLGQERSGIRALVFRLERLAEADERSRFFTPERCVNFLIDRIELFCGDNQEMLRSLMDGAQTEPAIILQEMVVGKIAVNSFAGVFNTREPGGGERRQLQVRPDAFGEEIMTGGAEVEEITFAERAVLRKRHREIYEIIDCLIALEAAEGAPLTFELTSERGMIAVLQMDKTSLSGVAALRSAVRLLREGKIKRSGLLEIVKPFHLRQLFSDTVEGKDSLRPFAGGLSILPRGEVCARAYFSAASALAARERGEKAIMIREIFQPADVEAMVEMSGLVSVSRSPVHVAQIARKYGIIALVGLSDSGAVPVIRENELVLPDGRRIGEGNFVVISSEEQRLYLGEAKTVPSGMTESKELWPELVYFKDELTRFAAAEVADGQALDNLVDLLLIFGETEAARQLVNRWFRERTESFLSYFAATRIGRHRSRLQLFSLLDFPFNQAELIRRLSGRPKNADAEGMFIIGRAMVWVEEKLGESALNRLCSGFSGELTRAIRAEMKRAREYLGVARAEKPATDGRALGNSMERILRAVLERKESGLSEEEADQVIWLAMQDIDPLHKPHKTIARALGELKK